eukprot:CAMPEP_0182468838 /NCGR_PEP_ID=MMETSP1319-20130603/16130_1 /TAXON_ID=172717 /ORGANISM="Bolidomonas pacifica, Strain RCC208" /LENGTH=63 /DNA_ID=CAMNT_0024669085 /DNA_START=193 /DNA_END=384 /DNA_ORIENTATION=+
MQRERTTPTVTTEPEDKEQRLSLYVLLSSLSCSPISATRNLPSSSSSSSSTAVCPFAPEGSGL